MIIICKECSTKFNLDDSALKGTGTQVRCSVCKNIFTAYPPHVLGNNEVSSTPAIPVQQGYFDSEEELGQGGAGGFQKAAPEDDDDGLELDVDEEDDEEMDDGGLDLGDDDTEFDDAGIDMGNNMPGMNTGMNFDEDMDDAGMPGMDFDADSDTGEIDLGTDINMNLDQGDEIELDAESDLKKDAVDPGLELPDLGPDPGPDPEPDLEPDPAADEGESAEEDFEFEFELGEDDNFEVEEDVQLDNLSDEPEQTDETEETDEDFDVEEDFELSIYDEDESPDKEEEAPTLVDVEEEDEIDQVEIEDDEIEFDSMELEIDNSDDIDQEDLIEEEDFTEEEFEDDDEYEIEEFDTDDEEYEDDDIIDEEYEDGENLDGKSKKPAKKSGKRLKLLLTMLLLLCLGYGSFTLTDGFTKFDMSKINFSMVKNLLNFSSMDEVPVWATINNQSLNGRYVNNESSGKLFVITGKITNESTLPINNIEVEGTLISKGGQVAKKKKVFCGNKIPEGQLSSLNVSNINRMLQRPNGEQNANINIQPNKSVPFMVVFSNLPNELENYTVTVTSFKRMKK